MKIGLQLNVGLQQTLTPQQIQYLKLLQLPALQMEHHIRKELEENPMLEELGDDGASVNGGNDDINISDFTVQTEQDYTNEVDPQFTKNGQKLQAPVSVDADGDVIDYETGAAASSKTQSLSQSDASDYSSSSSSEDTYSSGSQYETDSQEYSYDSDIPDDSDAFEFYKLVWQDDSENGRNSESGIRDDDDDFEPFQIKDVPTFEDELLEQINFLDLTEEQHLLAEQIIGNLDDDGYLRRDLREVLDDTNHLVEDTNHERRVVALESQPTSTAAYNDATPVILPRLNINQAEAVLRQIQQLEPAGCGSRTVQECLITQLRAMPKLNASQKLALEVLTKAYEPFTMKHYSVIARQLEVTEDYLREAVDVIRKLNPKPGTGAVSQGISSIIPDFVIHKLEDDSDIVIVVNDSTLPSIRVSSAYEKLKREARYRKFNKETREWMRKKHEDAKFLLNAIKQRKTTMLRVMTAIAGLQRDFFTIGPAGLRPLIYKDVAEDTAMDISTICRIVNNKYVQTEFGIYELRFFFSESLTNDDGDEVSTRIIKEKIKEIIDNEHKSKPFSDDKLTKELKKAGLNVARRTVAKYREQLKIPVARLRKEL